MLSEQSPATYLTTELTSAAIRGVTTPLATLAPPPGRAAAFALPPPFRGLSPFRASGLTRASAPLALVDPRARTLPLPLLVPLPLTPPCHGGDSSWISRLPPRGGI